MRLSATKEAQPTSDQLSLQCGGRNKGESQIKYEGKHGFFHNSGGKSKNSWNLVPAMMLRPRQGMNEREVSGFWKRMMGFMEVLQSAEVSPSKHGIHSGSVTDQQNPNFCGQRSVGSRDVPGCEMAKLQNEITKLDLKIWRSAGFAEAGVWGGDPPTPLLGTCHSHSGQGPREEP